MLRVAAAVLAIAVPGTCGAAAQAGQPAVPTSTPEQRLAALELTLPAAPAPVAAYAPFRVLDNLVYVSGQGPAEAEGTDCYGRLGAERAVAEGYACARLAALNVLAQLRKAGGGSLDTIGGCVRVGGFVQSVDGFTAQPQVVDGATDLLIAVLGDAGRPSRYAVGVNALPFNISVEIEAVCTMRQSAPKTVAQVTASEAPALGPYAAATVAGGWVYVSGQLPYDAASGKLLDGPVEEQARRALANVEALLVAAGSSRDRVTKVTVYLADAADFQGMNKVFAEFFGAHPPARTTAPGIKLPPGVRIEVDAIAIQESR